MGRRLSTSFADCAKKGPYRDLFWRGACCTSHPERYLGLQLNKDMWHRTALFMVMFLAGWNDASQGPLLPSLQRFYNVCPSFEVKLR